MKPIEEIDPNFKLNQAIPKDTVFYDPWEDPFKIYGLAPNSRHIFCRLPLSMVPECSEGVQQLAFHLAGGCIRFSTDAPSLSLIWELREKENMPHFTASGQSGMELFIESDEGIQSVKTVIPAMDGGCGCKLHQSSFISLPGGMRHYALYLPLYNGLNQLLLGFGPQARILPGRTPKIEKPIVFYGSSITQGGCASKTGNCYSTVLCRRLDAAQVNLGFSGNGKGEKNMAELVASLDMSAFVLDYDHNAPNADHLKKTHEQFFKIVRAAHPDVPIIMASRCDTDVPPYDCEERKAQILRTYENARAAGDQNVYFIDGKILFGEAERSACSVDGSHPNDFGFWRMANVFEPVLKKALRLE